ncbi:MAG: MBL fold metallo-hydrolase [Candidatus Paceibacterota bacterium]
MSGSIKIIFIILFCGAISLWCRVYFYIAPQDPELYFLPVGQGDAQLVRIGKTSILIDGGPHKSVLDSLDRVLGAGVHIDVIFVSHGQLDHIGGLFDVISSHSVGALLYQGEVTPLLAQLFDRAHEYAVPIMKIDTRDTLSYAQSIFTVLSLEQKIPSQSTLNDDSLVLHFATPHACALFTADIGFRAEKQLLNQYTNQLNCDVLKVAHHGSKNSSSNEFLRVVSPALSVIGVGKNSYGHPTQEALTRLIQAGSRVFRTDQEGIIKVIFKQDTIQTSFLKL